MVDKYIRPDFLKAGDTIGVVAFASVVSQQQKLSRWREIFESWGLKVKESDHLYDSYVGELSAPDKDRASDFMKFLLDDEIKAIISFRGGYGSMRTLSIMDFEQIKNHPKWIVGFSDITALHCAIQKCGVESILGSMPSTILKFAEEPNNLDLAKSVESLRCALFGEKQKFDAKPHKYNRPGVASGRLVGGNLTLFRSAVGTKYENHLDEDSILLLEDVDEVLYVIDRKMLSLQEGGFFSRAKGIIIGQFTDTQREEVWGCSAYDLINDYMSKLDIPVAFGFSSGHEHPNYSLYLGREVKFVVDEEGSRLEFI